MLSRFDKRTYFMVYKKRDMESIEDRTEQIKEYFQDYNEDIYSFDVFNLVEFAEYVGLTCEQAHVLLVNMEDDQVMSDIAKGNYDTFDQYDENQFNDGYEDTMEQLGLSLDDEDYE